MLNANLNDYFVILLTIIATLNGVAIPLSYNIISENLKPFLDKNISNIFLKEKAFNTNIIVSIGALAFFLLPLIINITKIFRVGNCNFISIAFTILYIVFSILVMTGFLMSFIDFSKMIYNYASNTEEVIFEKIKKEIDEYLGI